MFSTFEMIHCKYTANSVVTFPPVTLKGNNGLLKVDTAIFQLWTNKTCKQSKNVSWKGSWGASSVHNTTKTAWAFWHQPFVLLSPAVYSFLDSFAPHLTQIIVILYRFLCALITTAAIVSVILRFTIIVTIQQFQVTASDLGNCN